MKLKRLISALVVGGFLIQSIPVSAANKLDDVSDRTKQLMKMYPSFEESLKTDTTGELIGSIETYMKLEAKENIVEKNVYNNKTINEDYVVSYYDKDEYDEELKNNLVKNRGIGEQEGGTTYWLSLDLQVYPGSGQSAYMAYNFSSWITKPKFRFEDGIGISVSDGLVMSGDANSRHAEYRFANPYSPIGGVLKLQTEINNVGNGVLATSYLNQGYGGAFPELKEYHNFMVQTGISYNNDNVNQGWINGHYLHKQIALGSVGMDITGAPNLSIGGSTDKHSKSVHVTR